MEFNVVCRHSPMAMLLLLADDDDAEMLPMLIMGANGEFMEFIRLPCRSVAVFVVCVCMFALCGARNV